MNTLSESRLLDLSPKQDDEHPFHMKFQTLSWLGQHQYKALFLASCLCVVEIINSSLSCVKKNHVQRNTPSKTFNINISIFSMKCVCCTSTLNPSIGNYSVKYRVLVPQFQRRVMPFSLRLTSQTKLKEVLACLW